MTTTSGCKFLFELPTLIQAGVLTPNGNVYSLRVLRNMVDEANGCLERGLLIPVRDEILSKSIESIVGLVFEFSLVADGLLHARLGIFNEGYAKYVESMNCSVLNTLVMCNEGEYKKRTNGDLVIRVAKLEAVGVIEKYDASAVKVA